MKIWEKTCYFVPVAFAWLTSLWLNQVASCSCWPWTFKNFTEDILAKIRGLASVLWTNWRIPLMELQNRYMGDKVAQQCTSQCRTIIPLSVSYSFDLWQIIGHQAATQMRPSFDRLGAHLRPNVSLVNWSSGTRWGGQVDSIRPVLLTEAGIKKSPELIRSHVIVFCALIMIFIDGKRKPLTVSVYANSNACIINYRRNKQIFLSILGHSKLVWHLLTRILWAFKDNVKNNSSTKKNVSVQSFYEFALPLILQAQSLSSALGFNYPRHGLINEREVTKMDTVIAPSGMERANPRLQGEIKQKTILVGNKALHSKASTPPWESR